MGTEAEVVRAATVAMLMLLLKQAHVCFSSGMSVLSVT